MERRLVRIKQGLNIPVSGRPVQAVHPGNPVHRVALCGPDYIGIRPRLLVEKGEQVELGQPLFIDKHHPGIPYCSPGTGRVSAINRGPRRALYSVVVTLDDDTVSAERYAPMSRVQIQGLDRDAVAERLRESGLWTAFRTRPFSRVPEPDTVPRSIFVTAIDTRPLAADPRIILRAEAEAFGDGLSVLPALTGGPVFLCTAEDWDIPVPESERIRHVAFSGPHPAGLPGTHIHFLDPVGAHRSVWQIGYQDVIAIGKLFGQGRLDHSRVISSGGSGVLEPRLLLTRIGASIRELAEPCNGDCDEFRIVSGSMLDGRAAFPGLDFLGRYHDQISAVPEGGERSLFGWTGVVPWRYSATRTFLRQAGHKRRFNITTAQNGRYSGMIPTRAFEKVMPLDILPSPLFRAILVNDTEQAQALGCLELDEEDLALCAFVCPAKIDYGAALRINLQQIEREG